MCKILTWLTLYILPIACSIHRPVYSRSIPFKIPETLGYASSSFSTLLFVAAPPSTAMRAGPSLPSPLRRTQRHRRGRRWRRRSHTWWISVSLPLLVMGVFNFLVGVFGVLLDRNAVSGRFGGDAGSGRRWGRLAGAPPATGLFCQHGEAGGETRGTEKKFIIFIDSRQ